MGAVRASEALDATVATIRSTVQQEEPHAPIRDRAAADAVDVGVDVDPRLGILLRLKR